MSHILDQDEVWIDRQQQEHRIAEMDGRYATNIYEMLKRQCWHLAHEYFTGYLLQVQGPNGEMAAEAFERAIEDEVRRATEQPFQWLLSKPLVKALARRIKQDRIDKGWSNPNPEPQDPDYPDPRPTSTYEAPEFEVKPLPDLDEAVYGPQDGDSHRIFVVEAGDYEDRRIKGVFTGNRMAARRLINELDRYDPYAHASVTVWEDQAFGAPVGRVHSYRLPWPQVEFRTVIDLDTARIVQDCEPEVEVITDRDPDITNERNPVGHPGRYSVALITRGPDFQINRVREMHTNLVNETRAQVLADIKGETQ